MSATTRLRPELALLATLPPFDQCRPEELAPLAGHVDRLTVPRGRWLTERGRMAREVIVVLAGEVATTGADRELRSFGPGARFGGDEVLTGRPHPATLVARTDLEVLVVFGPAYRALCVAGGLGGRVRGWDTRSQSTKVWRRRFGGSRTSRSNRRSRRWSRATSGGSRPPCTTAGSGPRSSAV